MLWGFASLTLNTTALGLGHPSDHLSFPVVALPMFVGPAAPLTPYLLTTFCLHPLLQAGGSWQVFRITQLEKTSLDPRVWVVKAAGEQESVPIFRTCPKEGHWVRIPLSQLRWMPWKFFNDSLFLGVGERMLYSRGSGKSTLFDFSASVAASWRVPGQAAQQQLCGWGAVPRHWS